VQRPAQQTSSPPQSELVEQEQVERVVSLGKQVEPAGQHRLAICPSKTPGQQVELFGQQVKARPPASQHLVVSGSQPSGPQAIPPGRQTGTWLLKSGMLQTAFGPQQTRALPWAPAPAQQTWSEPQGEVPQLQAQVDGSRVVKIGQNGRHWPPQQSWPEAQLALVRH
jgi:hypothetical protein